MKKVFVIIPTINRKKDLKGCLESLGKLQVTSYKLQVIVVDNGSIDGTAQVISNLKSQISNLTLIQNKTNEGFCRANNQGIKLGLLGGGDYFFLLNDDCLVAPQTIGNLLKTASENKNLGVLGATVYAHSNRQKVTTTGENVNLWLGIGRMVPFFKDEDYVLVDRIAGCSMFIKREVFEKIGLLDENFFAYYEETDFCLRTKRADFLVAYVPKAPVWHKKEGVESAKPSTLYYITRNRALFVKKNAPLLQFLGFFFLYYFLYFPARLLLLFFQKRLDLINVLVWGMSDFLLGNYGNKRKLA